MPDLRFESSDGEYLHLEGEDGTSYKLLIDEGVRRAIRRDAITDQDSVKISPREIQLEVRAGVSLEELVAKTGASFEYIEKFAAPVVDELAYIVKSALSVRITMAGDRYSDTTQVEFGDVIATRLAAAGELTHGWTARRSDNGGWQLHCRYSDNVATWAFDPRKLALSPENENAVQLSTQQSLTDSPIPKLRPVSPAGSPIDPQAPATSSISTISTPQADASLAPVATVPPVASLRSISSIPNEDSHSPIETSPDLGVTSDLGRTSEFEGVVPFGRQNQQPAPASQGTEDLANTADLLDALRRRRLERENEANEPVTEQSANLDSESESGNQEDDAKPKKTGRASIPAWDSIVFGGKTEDD